MTAAMLAKAKEKASQSGVTNYRLQIGDAYDLAFENGRFDLLINNYMFDLLPKADFPKVLSEFQRVLKPGGRLLLVNMAKGRRWYNHIWESHLQTKRNINGWLSRRIDGGSPGSQWFRRHPSRIH